VNFKSFMKDKLVLTILLLFGIATIEIFLIPFKFGIFIKLYIPIVILFVYMLGILIEYFTKKSFYTKLFNMLNELEDKYLISEIIKNPSFLEGKLFKNAFEQIDKAMIENVNKYKYMRRGL